MHRASRVEVGLARFGRDDDAAAFCLADIVTKRAGDRIERQGPVS
jgi:hypothetical protein